MTEESAFSGGQNDEEAEPTGTKSEDEFGIVGLWSVGFLIIIGLAGTVTGFWVAWPAIAVVWNSVFVSTFITIIEDPILVFWAATGTAAAFIIPVSVGWAIVKLLNRNWEFEP